MNLSIENVPEPVVQRLRERAARRHRLLPEELLDIFEMAALEPPNHLADLAAEIRALGLSSASESVDMIREDRDSR
ncbi:MAG: hypothetical protein M3T55_05715 [Pseudomonadota bacterium]|nr:hypothetical protein [Pseudomonadota bacterium]